MSEDARGDVKSNVVQAGKVSCRSVIRNGRKNHACCGRRVNPRKRGRVRTEMDSRPNATAKEKKTRDNSAPRTRREGRTCGTRWSSEPTRQPEEKWCGKDKRKETMGAISPKRSNIRLEHLLHTMKQTACKRAHTRKWTGWR